MAWQDMAGGVMILWRLSRADGTECVVELAEGLRPVFEGARSGAEWEGVSFLDSAGELAAVFRGVTEAEALGRV